MRMRIPLRRQEPWILAAALAGVYLLLAPPSADLAAQIFRTNLFEQVGFTVWNGQWFAGHHVPGYSVLFPPLAALLGPRLVGAIAAVVAAVLFERLTYERFGARARLGALWFGAATATNLLTGRLTFSLGVVIGLAALLAHQRRRTALAVVLAVLCPMGSPVAGLFLAMAAVAHFLGAHRRDALWVAASALVATGVLQVAFPENGFEPFVISAFWPVLAFAAAVVLFVPRDDRTVRIAAVLYALACIAAFVVSTPMGGNAARLGTLFGPPVLALVLWQRRPWALALLALPLLYWQWSAPVRDVETASGDPSVHAAYYAGLERFLGSRPGGVTRVEIPLTRNHWENVYVAQRFPLARGWERQLDLKYNGALYSKRLSPSRYHAWLERTGVDYVAIPDVRLDYSGIPEAKLVRRGVPFLAPAWRDGHWRVYRVRRATPLASGATRVVAATPNSFALAATRPGSVTVRVRYTPYWTLVAGAGCVRRGAGGFTELLLPSPGYVRVVARFAPTRLLDPDSGAACRAGAKGT